MDQEREGGIELKGINVEEEYELSRVTSMDALNPSFPSLPHSSSSSSTSSQGDMYRVSSMDHLAPSSPSLYPPSTPDLATSLDNLTRIEEGKEGEAKRDSGGQKEKPLYSEEDGDSQKSCPDEVCTPFF